MRRPRQNVPNPIKSRFMKVQPDRNEAPHATAVPLSIKNSNSMEEGFQSHGTEELSDETAYARLAAKNDL
jgi:hypothetical protein